MFCSQMKKKTLSIFRLDWDLISISLEFESPSIFVLDPDTIKKKNWIRNSEHYFFPDGEYNRGGAPDRGLNNCLCYQAPSTDQNISFSWNH